MASEERQPLLSRSRQNTETDYRALQREESITGLSDQVRSNNLFQFSKVYICTLSFFERQSTLICLTCLVIFDIFFFIYFHIIEVEKRNS